MPADPGSAPLTRAAHPHSPPVDEDLLDLPVADMQARARALRHAWHGNRVTFSPKVFIPLTMLCRDRCGYCTFAKAPARVAAPYLSIDQVLEIANAGRAAGCHEALFTLGESPEDRYPLARRWLADHGYTSTVDYLEAACRAVVEQTGLLPHANAGALDGAELVRLRAVTASQGMMIESVNPDLPAHRSAPDKTPERRLATLEAAGVARIPFTTGLLVGFGESRVDRLDTLAAIAASHRRHGHVQEVIIQNFLPKPGTAMHQAPPCPPEEFHWTIAAARLILPRRSICRLPQPLRSARPPARFGNRRLGWGLAGHRRPRQPGAHVAGDRDPPSRHRSGRAHPGTPDDPLPGVRTRSRPVAGWVDALPGPRSIRCRRAGSRSSMVLGRRPSTSPAAPTPVPGREPPGRRRSSGGHRGPGRQCGGGRVGRGRPGAGGRRGPDRHPVQCPGPRGAGGGRGRRPTPFRYRRR